MFFPSLLLIITLSLLNVMVAVTGSVVFFFFFYDIVATISVLFILIIFSDAFDLLPNLPYV